jgi:hypothetical protein
VNLVPLPHQIIAHRQRELDRQPEKTSGGENPDQFFVPANFHKKQDDQNHLKNRERDDERRVEKFQVQIRAAENREMQNDQNHPGDR